MEFLDQELFSRPETRIKGSSVSDLASSNPAPAKFRGTYFVCLDCDYVFTVSESAYNSQPFQTHCPQCDRGISIEKIHTDQDMEVVELVGCEYRSRPTGKVPFSKTSHEPEKKPLSAHAQFMEEYEESQWVVEGRRGKQFTFHYCSALRAAIERGEIRGKDIIISPDGSRFRIDQYPGTADMFGNDEKIAEAQNYLEHSRPPKKKSGEKLFNFIFEMFLFVGAGAALAFFASNGPVMWKNWQNQKEQDWFQSVLTQAQPTTKSLEEMLLESSQAIEGKNSKVISAGISGFLGALSLEPTHFSALLGATEGWLNRAALSPSETDLINASKMLAYAEKRNPDHPAIIRLRAKHIWLSQGAKAAIEFLENRKQQLEKDLPTKVLLAQIALATKDYGKATLHLYDALKKDPNNIQLLETFVSLFEKQQKHAEAAAFLRKLIDRSQTPFTYQRKLAEILREKGDLLAAKQVYQDILSGNQGTEKDHVEFLKILSQESLDNQVISGSLAFFDQFPDSHLTRSVRDLYENSVAKIDKSSAPDRSKRKKSSRSTRRRRASRR